MSSPSMRPRLCCDAWRRNETDLSESNADTLTGNPRIKQITTLMYTHSVTVTQGRSRERARHL